MDATAQQVLDLLTQAGIPHTVKEHPPVYTIGEMEALELDKTAPIAKNLFLRDDKKRHFYLVVLPGNKKADLKALRRALQSKPLSFASEEDLEALLRLQKGAVTPLGILNDDGRRVEVVLDRELLDLPRIGVHPNVNTATVWISPADLIGIAEAHGNPIWRVQIE